LPAGWSGPGDFTCSATGSGSSCVLTLTYAWETKPRLPGPSSAFLTRLPRATTSSRWPRRSVRLTPRSVPDRRL
jgi:hypothetical protein